MTISIGTPYAEPTGASLVHRMRAELDRARYRAGHEGLAVSLGLATRAIHRMIRPEHRVPPRAAIDALHQRFVALLTDDLDNVERGVYPRALLDLPWGDYLKVVPEALRDGPRLVARARRRAHDDLPSDVPRDRYPAYYLRNFHWQTDGWLSDRSARLYDLSVEVLFGGTADVMRRMAIPPVVSAIGDAPSGRPRGDGARVLDLACGTGRFLLQLQRALPGARLYGVDLSPNYVDRARALLADVPEVTLLADDAEALPFRDGLFDVVTSVFLFHELPRDVRRRVLGEARRVLRPGGRLVVCDSAQRADASELAFFLDAFGDLYHEPYYKSYLADDLEALFHEAGFVEVTARSHFLSRVVAGTRAS